MIWRGPLINYDSKKKDNGVNIDDLKPKADVFEPHYSRWITEHLRCVIPHGVKHLHFDRLRVRNSMPGSERNTAISLSSSMKIKSIKNYATNLTWETRTFWWFYLLRHLQKWLFSNINLTLALIKFETT